MKLLALLCISSWSLTLAQLNLHTYELDKLTSLPGNVLTSTNFAALIEFEDEIQDVLNPREDLIQDIRASNRLYIRANKPSGSTNLWVIVQGKSAQFTIVVDQSLTSGHLYSVITPQPESSTAQVLRPGIATTTSLPVAQGVPPYQFEAHVVSRDEGKTVISYSLQNKSGNILVNDPQRLQVLVSSEAVAYQLSRSNTSPVVSRIFAEQSEVGQLEIAKKLEGEIYLVWDIVEQGVGNSYRIEYLVP
jgi:hypothetical protein